jgi:hypothetical protein
MNKEIDETNKKENEAELKRLRKEMGNKMCPVFECNCKQNDCMSYFEGRLREYKIGNNMKYKLHKPCCNSPLVNGAIYHE